MKNLEQNIKAPLTKTLKNSTNISKENNFLKFVKAKRKWHTYLEYST